MEVFEKNGFSDPGRPPEDSADAAEAAVESGLTQEADAVSAVESAVRTELAELRDRHARLAAEFDNYRKRVTRERAELTDRAQAQLVAQLLDGLDDLDRLVASDAATTTVETLRPAVDAAQKKLAKELAAAGVERIEPTGAPFDPSRHEAVSIVPPPDPSKDHQVSATFQTGYALKGTLIRPARVQVYSSEGLG